ncbi:E3 ubiquitin-protein ligase RNF216 [Aspergillus melleus]|uniref:E3 ubiquitin-protein ligase RNF216 n=1 Tax=Aspergillus melleus TaxID=138277 RepID=UPI001E8E805A|nr:uncharacterized protein LDX57_007255 [Aspergillus melleus]KAH8429587.1 hypothetical protein LDX57_007255 [Aspergillus melleus]
MSQIPIGNRALRGEETNRGTLRDDYILPGEDDFLPWGLGGRTSAMGDDADYFHLSTARPMKRGRTRAPDTTVDTAIPVDNYLPLDPALHPTLPQFNGGRDSSVSVPKPDDRLLAGILEIFPDISHKYVFEFLATRQASASNDGANVVDTSDRVKEELIEYILAKNFYPKQDKPKRKLEQTDDGVEKWRQAAVGADNPLYFHQACDVLGQEFLRVPVTHIRQVMSEKKGLYTAYLTIYLQEMFPGDSNIPYARLKKPRTLDQGKYHNFRGLAELGAAKQQAQKKKLTIQQRVEEEELERRNEEESAQAGTLVECQCCYIDTPLNRTTPCEGETAHFFCFTCIRKSAETQIGLMKWRLQCFDISGCQENFDRSRLKQTLGPSLMEKLDSLQQEDEIQQAGLEGLECCPFCDFKAICGPVAEDREFHCQNPSCEKVSCRLCNDESHIPKTCLEAKKDKGLPERHAVEEAMSEALIRNCPRCKVKIVKENGCNRMQCSKCGCNMCYVCRKDITQEYYGHFGRAPSYCKTHDGHENRHRDDVERAQRATISEVLSRNPDLTEKDLLIHESTPGKISNAAPRPRFAAPPVNLPIQRALQEVRAARMGVVPQPLRAGDAPENYRALNRFGDFGDLPPAYGEYPEFLFPQQQVPRHVPRADVYDLTTTGSGRLPTLPPAPRFPPL